MSMIIEHFGKVLHDETQKPLLACKGLIRLAYKDVYGKDVENKITYEEMEKLIEDGLRNRLKKLNIENIDALIEKLQTEREKNQPIFKLGTF